MICWIMLGYVLLQMLHCINFNDWERNQMQCNTHERSFKPLPEKGRHCEVIALLSSSTLLGLQLSHASHPQPCLTMLLTHEHS